MNEPIFAALAAEWAAGLGPTGGAHHWREHTEEVPVGRHDDHDGDGLADQADPDWPGDQPEPAAFVPAYETWTPCEERDDPHDEPEGGEVSCRG